MQSSGQTPMTRQGLTLSCLCFQSDSRPNNELGRHTRQGLRPRSLHSWPPWPRQTQSVCVHRVSVSHPCNVGDCRNFPNTVVCWPENGCMEGLFGKGKESSKDGLRQADGHLLRRVGGVRNPDTQTPLKWFLQGLGRAGGKERICPGRF